MSATAGLELTIVMPCLDEAETLASCIRKARGFLEGSGVAGEVLVADNGSSDGSQAIARAAGARVVEVAEKGYGSALRAGIEAAAGRYVIMGDADDSYDFAALGAFLARLRQGDDLVMGNRFQGGIRPGAMPALHRYLGNPVLTAIGRLFFRSPAGDFHCGLRGFSREAFLRMELQTTGMEFASEMVVSATLKGMRISEVPIVLYKDGRSRPPHLRSWRDGWRHLRFMLLYSPDWLFLYPGLALFIVGLVLGGRLAVGPMRLGGAVLDIHTLLVSGFLLILGYEIVLFAIFTKLFAVREGFLPDDPLARAAGAVGLERGALTGLAATALGLGLMISAVASWHSVHFGSLDPRVTMRQVIPAIVVMVLGLQTLFSSFLFSLFTLRKRRP